MRCLSSQTGRIKFSSVWAIFFRYYKMHTTIFAQATNDFQCDWRIKGYNGAINYCITCSVWGRIALYINWQQLRFGFKTRWITYVLRCQLWWFAPTWAIMPALMDLPRKDIAQPLHAVPEIVELQMNASLIQTVQLRKNVVFLDVNQHAERPYHSQVIYITYVLFLSCVCYAFACVCLFDKNK